MYEGPIIFESHAQDKLLITGLILIGALIVLLFLVALSKIFKKAEKKSWQAFIPIYNIYILLQVVALPSYYMFLLLVPIINLYPIYRIARELARVFRRPFSFACGLLFLPIVYYPLLAFSQDRYVGINEEKVESIILEIPEEEEKGPVIEENSNLIPVENRPMIENANNQNMNSVITQENNKTPIQVQVPEFKSTTPEHKECPSCHNQVMKDAPTCFICGYKF